MVATCSVRWGSTKNTATERKQTSTVSRSSKRVGGQQTQSCTEYYVWQRSHRRIRGWQRLRRCSREKSSSLSTNEIMRSSNWHARTEYVHRCLPWQAKIAFPPELRAALMIGRYHSRNRWSQRTPFSFSGAGELDCRGAGLN